jgi:hypothetical protein
MEVLMSAFCRVEPQHAGPGALGILVPPGTRTLVIVRPRSVDFDLLPARWDGAASCPPEFCLFEREQAAQVARRFQAALEEAVRLRVNPVETLGDSAGRSFQVWVRAAGLFWIPCQRSLGRAYRPLVFESQDAARTAGETLARIVWPAAEAGQEYYFNTQRFI